MAERGDLHNEELSAAAFTKQSAIFDEIYASNTIVSYKRARVRNHLAHYLRPESNILELNAGTGEDATFFAGHSHHIHATDISEGMLGQLSNKAKLKGLSDRISTEQCSYTQLGGLKNKGPFDLIFSNFAGLNCTDELDKVLLSLKPLLAKQGLVTLVMLPKFCLWETLLLFKGKFKTAFRRFKRDGTDAHVEGVHFKCWYYNPSFVTNVLKDDFDVVSVEGLCTIVPPSYIEHFAEKHPKTYAALVRAENRLKARWPWRQIGDYYIITLKLK